MSYDGKKRLDDQPTMQSADFDVGVCATRLLGFTRKMIRTGHFNQRAKHDQDVLAAMDTARAIMLHSYKANEMTRTRQLEQRLSYIREVIGELCYFENLVYSFWADGYISGEQWADWIKQIRIVKGKAIRWYNKNVA